MSTTTASQKSPVLGRQSADVDYLDTKYHSNECLFKICARTRHILREKRERKCIRNITTICNVIGF